LYYIRCLNKLAKCIYNKYYYDIIKSIIFLKECIDDVKNLAMEFLLAGCNVTLSGRGETLSDLTLKELSAFEVKYIYVKCNVQEKESLQNLWDVSLQKHQTGIGQKSFLTKSLKRFLTYWQTSLRQLQNFSYLKCLTIPKTMFNLLGLRIEKQYGVL